MMHYSISSDLNRNENNLSNLQQDTRIIQKQFEFTICYYVVDHTKDAVYNIDVNMEAE